MFSPDQWSASTGVAFYNGVATQSLRFDRADSAYLSRSPSASNRKTWTWSGWIKRSKVGAGQRIFHASNDSNNRTEIYFTTNDKIDFFSNVASVHKGFITTNQVFRDVSAWYHFVFVLDAENTSFKIYLNGSEITDLTVTDSIQNTDHWINSTSLHTIGRYTPANSNYLDGYMSEVNFVDGSALDPTSFGETKNGVWIPIEYTGSYGTNGFRLQFNQTGTGTASSSTIGADTSGNDNHWTSSGIVASDCDMPDSPENNFCTLNPLFATGVTNTFSEGNLKVATSSSGRPSIASSFVMPTGTGKWFFEARVSGDGGGIGIMRTDAPYNNDFYYGDYQWSVYGHSVIHNGASAGSLTGSATYPEVYGLMLDTDTDTLKVYVGGSEVGSFSVDAGYDYYPISGDGSGAISITSQLNFGQDSTFQGDEIAGGNVDANGIGDFSMTVPTGALALCTANLPEPTISPNADTQADDYFNTVLYTGNGSSTHAITGVGFQADLNWLKERSSDSAPMIHDVIRETVGAGTTLNPDRTDAESTNSTRFKSFDSDGFTVGSNTGSNESGQTYVAWNWKAGGTAVSNTDGTITSSVSANTDAGFSIVTYTGTGSSATVGHGLGVSPNVIIVKNRIDASDWFVYHSANTSAPETDVLQLNLNDATVDFNPAWNDTLPTSSVFTVGTSNASNGSSDTMVAYCFAEIEGYSKFGSYEGNALADGTFVYTGFRPAWVLVKDADTSGYNWYLYDNTRDTDNVNSKYLAPNTSGTEINYSGDGIDFLSNGFKLRTLAGGRGTNRAVTYVYMAFAEAPFKYANAR